MTHPHSPRNQPTIRPVSEYPEAPKMGPDGAVDDVELVRILDAHIVYDPAEEPPLETATTRPLYRVRTLDLDEVEGLLPRVPGED